MFYKIISLMNLWLPEPENVIFTKIIQMSKLLIIMK